MPIRLNTITLAAMGFMSAMNSPAERADDSGGTEKTGGRTFEDFVEAGEEAYDRILTDMTDARDRFAEQVRSGASKFLSDLGLATKQEIENLRDDLDLKKDKK